MLRILFMFFEGNAYDRALFLAWNLRWRIKKVPFNLSSLATFCKDLTAEHAMRTRARFFMAHKERLSFSLQLASTYG